MLDILILRRTDMLQKKIAGEKAAEYIKDGMILGMGTGSTAYYMIKRVGELVAGGLKIKAVATSKSTENLAAELNIPLLTVEEVDSIDLVIDGVDEIDPQFNAIKGGGGALFREKIVAKLAKEIIWIMDESKLVDAIGNFPLPVEILPYGYTQHLRRLEEFGFNPVLRLSKEGDTYITDNGNYIADLHLGKPMNIEDVHHKLRDLTGVLETGLFLNMCNRIVVGTDDGVKVIENSTKELRIRN
ncbi:ribose-5-phosphate isomerase RpiA [Saccharicrinis sp. FJH62]|uniref:ribose-5-phosphate isomerase RpiA n=1 Tax=Saccharicrinis sp. FJH62 TaxID=3344657 RepID=UPI0035D3FC5D